MLTSRYRKHRKPIQFQPKHEFTKTHNNQISKIKNRKREAREKKQITCKYVPTLLWVDSSAEILEVRRESNDTFKWPKGKTKNKKLPIKNTLPSKAVYPKGGRI